MHEILENVKTDLSLSDDFDSMIKNKILVVKGFMRNAGVSETKIESDVSIGAITIGVTDLWNMNAGEIKFSPAFNMMVTQLALGK